ncbi:MAG: hypothetical protein GY855_07650 [candidate division Zixibacteria bacterium]|nr:hypothetical protein [candidate division Zixibacteria bacterium]
MFSLETLVLVIIANFLALPLVWYIGNLWLAEFPQRVNIGISVFAAGGAIVLLIALFTVSSQAFKASRTNPVEVLRYE